MPVVSELIRIEDDGTISFGNYMLAAKSKLQDFEFHARNRAIASIDDDADMNNGHDAAAGSRCDIGKDGKACIGSGHVIVATCVVVSAALSLALLAFWGLLC